MWVVGALRSSSCTNSSDSKFIRGRTYTGTDLLRLAGLAGKSDNLDLVFYQLIQGIVSGFTQFVYFVCACVSWFEMYILVSASKRTARHILLHAEKKGERTGGIQ